VHFLAEVVEVSLLNAKSGVPGHSRVAGLCQDICVHSRVYSFQTGSINHGSLLTIQSQGFLSTAR